jgi:hypothetical protein
MTSINKILNDALEQNLLTESDDPMLKEMHKNNEMVKALQKDADVADVKVPLASDEFDSGKPGATLAQKAAGAFERYKLPVGAGAAAAIAAGLGALALAKKLRAKKEAAKKKDKKEKK